MTHVADRSRNAWLLDTESLDHFLDMAFEHHHGEVWLYNNDLAVLRSRHLFDQLYVAKICRDLSANVDAVKIILNPRAEAAITGSALDQDLLDNLAYIAQLPDGPVRLSTFYFGSLGRDSGLPHVKSPALLEQQVSGEDTWVFYVHDGNLEAPSRGVSLVRPADYPFSGQDGRYSMAWMLQSEVNLQHRMARAFHTCFSAPDNFRWLEVVSVEPFQFRWREGLSPETGRRRALRRGAGQQPVLMEGDQVDVAIIAVAEEMVWIEEVFPCVRKTPSDADGFHYTLIHRKRAPPLKVLLATISRQGTMPAALTTWHLINRWRPRLGVILAGTCAGVRGIPEQIVEPKPSRRGRPPKHPKRQNYELGDIVLAEKVIHYEYEKILEGDDRLFRDNKYPTDSYLLEKAKHFAHNWNAPIEGRPERDHVAPRCFKGSVASGDKLVENSQFAQTLRSRDDTVKAVEMEAAGVAFACATHPHHSPFIVLKAAMDWGDVASRNEPEKDGWQKYATRVSARFVRDLLESPEL